MPSSEAPTKTWLLNQYIRNSVRNGIGSDHCWLTKSVRCQEPRKRPRLPGSVIVWRNHRSCMPPQNKGCDYDAKEHAESNQQISHRFASISRGPLPVRRFLFEALHTCYNSCGRPSKSRTRCSFNKLGNDQVNQKTAKQAGRSQKRLLFVFVRLHE